MVILVEAGSAAVLALFAVLARPRLRDVLSVAAGAWIGEEICIRVYDAYQYAPSWSVFLDRVPLAVVVIWPAVVLSARSVSRALRVPVFAVVLFDAFFVEPIATHAGLWSWNLPGLFGVPPIGPVGWACYAAAACFLLERKWPFPLERKWAPLVEGSWVSLGAPLLAHVGILAAWWGALRWLSADIAPAHAAAAAGVLCCVAMAFAWRRRLSMRDAAPRAAAAGLFGALLFAAPDPALIAYAAPFALPWLLLLR